MRVYNLNTEALWLLRYSRTRVDRASFLTVSAICMGAYEAQGH
jgi:hypothetical protein